MDSTLAEPIPNFFQMWLEKMFPGLANVVHWRKVKSYWSKIELRERRPCYHQRERRRAKEALLFEKFVAAREHFMREEVLKFETEDGQMRIFGCEKWEGRHLHLFGMQSLLKRRGF